MENIFPNSMADDNGYYGSFGGAYIPELLHNNINELKNSYQKIISSPKFQEEFINLLTHYAGRPTPLYFAKRLTQKYGFNIYLKREDLCHTGAHKINNTIGQILMAKHLKKSRIIAETGAGQHGVATATVCALMGLKCIVYMGAKDIERQQPNVKRMKLLGAQVIPAISGSQTLKDATNEALRDWIQNPDDTFYLIGSVVGPHPYPEIVTAFQSVISKEMLTQFQELTNKKNPNYVIACVGGGSNAIGAFYHYLNNDSVKLIGVEAAGCGLGTGKTAATITEGSVGILHGSKTFLLQTNDGQVIEAHSISAGLDYPGIGPVHSFLSSTKRVEYISITDEDALQAGKLLCKKEGIIPALESAHALAALEKLKLPENTNVIVNLSGRGDKDMETYSKFIDNQK